MRYNKEKTEIKWQQNFMIAMQYYIEFGHLDGPYNKEYRRAHLGNWINYQRLLYQKEKLSEEKIVALQSIGMTWSKQRKLKIKEKQLNLLFDEGMTEDQRQTWMRYYYQFKNSTSQNEELNAWLEEQLILMDQKRLSPERERLLIRKGIYDTKVYKKFFRKMARQVFKNIIMYYKEYHIFPDDTDIVTHLDRTLDEWCIHFHRNINGILSDKEYFIWETILKKRESCNVKLKEKVLKK